MSILKDVRAVEAAVRAAEKTAEAVVEVIVEMVVGVAGIQDLTSTDLNPGSENLHLLSAIL